MCRPRLKKFLTQDERAIATERATYRPKDSDRKKEEIVRAFFSYCEERGEKGPLKASPDRMCQMLSSFWADRRKQGGGIHDVGTLESQYSRLASFITLETGFNPTIHPDFEQYRQEKRDKLKQSKNQPGNGIMAHQADALDPEEISSFYETGQISIGSGWGITRKKYLTFMTCLNMRAIKEHIIMKLGNLRVRLRHLNHYFITVEGNPCFSTAIGQLVERSINCRLAALRVN